MKIKPLFIWSGGKTKMFKHYEPLLPENDIKSYSEPFFGGGAMFLHILEKYDLSNIYINDVNSGIIEISVISIHVVKNSLKFNSIYECNKK